MQPLSTRALARMDIVEEQGDCDGGVSPSGGSCVCASIDTHDALACRDDEAYVLMVLLGPP